MVYTTLVVLTATLLTLYHRYNRSASLINKIPGPRAWPIIGNSLNYFLPPEKLFAYQRNLPKLYGNVNQIHGLSTHMVNISNPEDIEVILSSPQYNNKQKPYTFIRPWLGEGLFTSNDLKWHQRRKLLTKSFHFNILKKFVVTFGNRTKEFTKKVQKEVGQKQTDLFPLVSNTTLSIMCETAMGVTIVDGIESVMTPYIKAIHSIGDIFSKRMARAWLHFETIFQLTSLAKIQKCVISEVHSFINKIIKERRSYLEDKVIQFDEDSHDNFKSKHKLAMLDLLLESEKSGVINNEGIREEVDTFMFGGHDTTAIAMTFMIVELANAPDIQHKVYSEMRQIFGDNDRLPTMEDLNEMKYLECCIKETIRKYPSGPQIMRCLPKDTILGGYTVPAGTTCVICIYDVHHRADLYPDPERFIPERFLQENSSQRHPFAYIPFSAGPRNCIGQKFALLEIKVVMSGLLRKFRLEPVTKPSDLVYKTDITLRTTHSIFAKFCLRK